LLTGAFGVGPTAADTAPVIVNDNPAAPKIGMALLRCEACFTRDISILPDKRGHSIQQVMLLRGDATRAVSKISGTSHKNERQYFGQDHTSDPLGRIARYIAKPPAKTGKKCVDFFSRLGWR
jgi:hypothetical protein